MDNHQQETFQENSRTKVVTEVNEIRIVINLILSSRTKCTVTGIYSLKMQIVIEVKKIVYKSIVNSIFYLLK